MTEEMAFPQSTNPEGPTGGMTVRDKFAAAALPVIFSHIAVPGDDKSWKEIYRLVSKHSYGIADAMLKRREK